jgi:hypothetical protein
MRLTGFGKCPIQHTSVPRGDGHVGFRCRALGRRPSEVAALAKDGCYLPSKGWGHLTFADSSPTAGRAFTDDGKVHEHRGLKGRSDRRPRWRWVARVRR